MFADSLVRGLHEQALAGAQAPLEDPAFWNPPRGPLCLQQVRTSCDSVYQPHSHPEYGIVVCLKGEVLKTQLGRTTLIGPGESVMSNSGVEHASGYLAGPHGCEVLCLTVERRALARRLPTPPVAALSPPVADRRRSRAPAHRDFAGRASLCLNVTPPSGKPVSLPAAT